MKKIEVFFKTNTDNISLKCEVAGTLREKMKGLMYREQLAKNNGMIFDFKLPWPRLFWMKNVKIPLDIIFVNANLEIINISEASVETGLFYKNYWSHGFCRYVIETNMGFCKKNNISKGTKIEIKKEI